jgi:hypothetical protein
LGGEVFGVSMRRLVTWIERTRRLPPLACARAWTLGGLVLLYPFAASALVVSLDIELDTGLTADFVRVDIIENGDHALDFIITVDTDLLGADRIDQRARHGVPTRGRERRSGRIG